MLEPEVAAGFLVTRTGDRDEQAATELAGELGGLPLALEQAAAYVQASGGSLAGYLASFRQRRPEMLARGGPPGMARRWRPPGRWRSQRLEQSALGRLASCDCWPSAPLSRSRCGCCCSPGPGLPTEVAPVLVPLLGDELAAGDAIAALRRYSLVTLAGDGLVSVHRLVQVVTADQMPAELAAAWHDATAAVIEAALPSDPNAPETWPVFAALLPHAQAAFTDDSDGMETMPTTDRNYPGDERQLRAASASWLARDT